MALRIQQLSDHGIENPIVARLSVQTKELLNFYNLSGEQKEEIFGLMFLNIQPRLLACFRIMEQLRQEVREQQKRIDKVGLEFQAQGKVYTTPSILDLQLHAETFLYNGKSSLRELTNIFKILFSKDFKQEARFDNVLKWSNEEFGADDSLSKMMKDDEGSWIKKIVRMRNAVEHPGGYSGTLHIEDFSSIEKEGEILIIEPMWYLNIEEKSPIVHEMDVMVANLLTFCEETLILCLEKCSKTSPYVIMEIPEQERDVECPIRFRVTIDPSNIKLGPDA
jgi:hypothetical protein